MLFSFGHMPGENREFSLLNLMRYLSRKLELVMAAILDFLSKGLQSSFGQNVDSV